MPELTPDQIATLPVGAVVRDNSDTYVRQEQPASWHSDGGIKQWWTSELQRLVGSDYGPIVLVSLPDDATATDAPDLYQQARIALRDVLGMEPDDRWIRFMVRELEADTDAGLALERTLREFQDPAPARVLAARHVDVSGLLDADFGVVVFVKDNDVAGLARLRAHAALDALLDQHGISR